MSYYHSIVYRNILHYIVVYHLVVYGAAKPGIGSCAIRVTHGTRFGKDEHEQLPMEAPDGNPRWARRAAPSPMETVWPISLSRILQSRFCRSRLGRSEH